VRRRADGQGARMLPLNEAFGRNGNAIEGVTNVDEIGATGLRDDEALVLAVEQFDAELLLQRLDLMADGALGQEQLFGRAGETAMAGSSLERPERIEYGKATTHGDRH